MLSWYLERKFIYCLFVYYHLILFHNPFPFLPIHIRKLRFLLGFCGYPQVFIKLIFPSLFWKFLTFWSCWYRLVPLSECWLLCLSSSLFQISRSLSLFILFIYFDCFFKFHILFLFALSLSLPLWLLERVCMQKKKQERKYCECFNIVSARPNENWRVMKNTTISSHIDNIQCTG